MALFGTNGVRGKLEVLTPGLAFSLSMAFASWSRGKKIAVARDMRITSPMLHSACKAGVMASGCDAIDIGLCSSPVAEFTLARLRADGLIIVTASHNPAEWNALKFVDRNGVAVSRERGEEIERMAIGGEMADARGSAARLKNAPSGKPVFAEWKSVGQAVEEKNAAAKHAEAVLKFVDAEKIRRRHLRVCLDFGNGTSALSHDVFARLGCEVIALNGKVDGTFPGRPSEPSEQNVQGLCKAVKQESANFGVAWDGDSDRVVFVDEKGRWIVGDKGFAISAAQACKEKKAQPGKLVVTTVATSRCVEDACAAHGAKTIYTKVGAPYLSEKMHELGKRAVSGGEEVGGIIWPGFSLAKDGILAAAKIAEMVCETPLTELVDGLPTYYNAKSKPEVSPEKKVAGLEAAKKHAQVSGGRVTLIDGVRVDFEDSWVIVRASGTENAMRIFAEAKSARKAEALMKEMEGAVLDKIG